MVAMVIVGALAAPSPALGDTFTVTRFGDPAPDGCGAGDCSLREAIIAANANTGSDRIPLRAGTYQLSILGTAEDAAANGDLDVTGSLRITGAGLGATAIDGGGDVTGERVLHLDPTTGGLTVAVRLSRLTVTGGGNATSSFGGGIRADNESNLSLTRAAVSGNTGSSFGGGLYIDGATATFSHSVLSRNTLTSAFGGAIFNSGDARTTIVDSIVNRNESDGFSAGIYNNNDTRLVIRRSTLSGNTSGGYAGAIYNQNDSVMTIRDSTLNGNRADLHGGALYLQNDSVTNLINTTVSGNVAGQNGGGVHIQNDPTVRFRSTTITKNSAALVGGGVHVLTGGFGGTFAIHSTLLAGNTAGDAGPDCGGEPGAVDSLGFNLIGNASGCAYSGAGSDLVGSAGAPINARLKPLRNNGGPTTTHSFKRSPAKNKVPKAQKQSNDQRGAPRRGRGDIGAYELARCGGVIVNRIGTDGRDTLGGGGGKDGILGLGGRDTLKGKRGKDGLCGGDGRDTLRGGPGNDRLNGDSGRDKCRGGPGNNKLRSCER